MRACMKQREQLGPEGFGQMLSWPLGGGGMCYCHVLLSFVTGMCYCHVLSWQLRGEGVCVTVMCTWMLPRQHVNYLQQLLLK